MTCFCSVSVSIITEYNEKLGADVLPQTTVEPLELVYNPIYDSAESKVGKFSNIKLGNIEKQTTLQ